MARLQVAFLGPVGLAALPFPFLLGKKLLPGVCIVTARFLCRKTIVFPPFMIEYEMGTSVSACMDADKRQRKFTLWTLLRFFPLFFREWICFVG